MKKISILTIASTLSIMILSGCTGVAKKATDSASTKNLGVDGYFMFGELETNNPETMTPKGSLIIGRLSYKSRKVGIPADQKVPTAGNFKSTKTKSLFGTEELIIEYDFTAGSDADAKAAIEELEKRRKESENEQTGK